MQYLLMIYQHEEERRPRAKPAPRRARSTSGSTRRIGARDVLRGWRRAAAHEHGDERACALNGDVLLTDGPFAETEEQLAGYYVIECETLDDAIEIAAAVPGARHGTIEIRPQIEGVGPSRT